MKKNDKLTFASSCGMVVTDHLGHILPESDLDDWLLEIKRIDVGELNKYLAENQIINDRHHDIMCVSCHMKDGTYNPLDLEFRDFYFNGQPKVISR